MKTGKYRHFRNHKDYQLLGVAFDTATDGKVVLYQALYECPELSAEYGANPIFTRPYDVFFETVEHDGTIVPRFKYIGQ